MEKKNNLLKSKSFELNEYPEGKFWELVVKEDEELKYRIAKIFGAVIETYVDGVDIDTLILQCKEDGTKCLFYYDCNDWDMSTKDFFECVEQI